MFINNVSRISETLKIEQVKNIYFYKFSGGYIYGWNFSYNEYL